MSGCEFEAAVYNSLGVEGRSLVEVIPDIENGQLQTQLKISQRSDGLRQYSARDINGRGTAS
jgi:hypothetical protein